MAPVVCVAAELDFGIERTYSRPHGLGEPDRRRPWQRFQGLSFSFVHLPAPDLIDGIHSIRLTNGSAANLIRQAFDGVGGLAEQTRAVPHGLRGRVFVVHARVHVAVRVARDLVDVVSDVPDLRPDGLQLFDDGARLVFLFRGFEVGARLVRLDQVTRDADAFHVRGRADLLEFLVGNADEDPPAAGPSRPVLLVPAHGAHSLFRVLGRRGRFTVRPPRRRRRRRNHRCGAVAAPSKSLRHSGQSPPRRRSGGQVGLCAQTV